jgi:hypothetical protein
MKMLLQEVIMSLKTLKLGIGGCVALVFALMITSPRSASAQWSLEARTGAANPVGDLADAPGPQDVGLGAAGTLMYTFDPNVTAYGEASGQWFTCDGCDTDVVNWGFDGGLKYLFAEDGRASPWVRAGVALQQAVPEDGQGEWGIGLDSGVGVDVQVTDQLAVVPAVRFDTYDADEMTVSYFTFDLGAHWHPNP